MNPLSRTAQLVRLIIVEGKFRHSGYRFENARRKALQELEEFCRVPHKKRNFKSPFVQYWFGQAAFIKNAFRSQGGHLCVASLKLCYIRNPKAASTALSYAMLTACYPELRKRVITPETVNFLADSNLHRKSADAIQDNVYFTVVRNPFARIVSVYREFFERKRSDFIYADYLFGIFRQDLSFKDFVSIVRMIPDKLKDQHLRPQHTFLKFYERRGIQVRILKLEEPQAVGDFLSGYGLAFKALNQSDNYDYRTYYDEHTLELVHRLYEEDMRRFSYAPIMAEIKSFWVSE